MNYLVIDLEMCNVPRDYRSRSYKYANETIQIGAVLLDEEFKRIGTLSQYVHPEHGVIDPFIQNLTGIRNSQVKKAPRIEEALLHMIDWIGDREYKVYAWSGSDRAQLLHEIKAKKICDERILDFVCEARWIDYQDVFVKRFGIERKIGLEEALGRVEIEPEGRLHDLSLGGKEEKAKNKVMAAVGDRTRAQEGLLQEDSMVESVVLEWNAGGHFADAGKRLAKGVKWMFGVKSGL